MDTSSAQQESKTLASLCAAAGLDCPAEAGGVTVSGVTADSRRVCPGWLFIAVSGRNTDARQFIPAAAQAGAVAAVCEDTGDGVPPAWTADMPILTVRDIRTAMAYLFDAWYGHPGRRLRLVGVTGTNGKTSVASMLHHILIAAGVPCGIIGTVGCISPSGEPLDGLFCGTDAGSRTGMTTPDPEELYAMLSRMGADASRQQDALHQQEADGQPQPQTDTADPVATVIMEVTSHALALSKVAPLRFDLAVFTNLSSEHMDFHGTMEAYFAAKRRLFTMTRTSVIDISDPYGRRLLGEGLSVERWYLCSMGQTPGDVPIPPDSGIVRCTASDMTLLSADGVEYLLSTPDARLRVHCPVPGEFSARNSLEAAVSALALGLPPRTVQAALRTFPGVPGRLERVICDCPTDFSVFIDFAHTPDALEKLLGEFVRLRRMGERSVGSCGSGRTSFAGFVRRIIVLFGCGGDRDRSKRKRMGLVASRMADEVVITSDNSRSEEPGDIIRDILTGIDKERAHIVIPDRREAIRWVIRTARPGDVILLCGKGHETYEVDRTGKHPFCERDIVCQAVAEFHRR